MMTDTKNPPPVIWVVEYRVRSAKKWERYETHHETQEDAQWSVEQLRELYMATSFRAVKYQRVED
jgi:hypothetical protein